MIIARTPYRISFFGGGTDYPAWYESNGGAVLSTTIDKYCYVSVRYLPPFFEHKHRIVWSQTELVQNIDEIRHPSIRETLKLIGISNGVEIHHNGDLPSWSGMGTSSSFTVGLLHALYALKGIMPAKMQLAKEAIYIEQEMIKENVGSQDQVAASFGGLNRIDFGLGDNIEIHPIVLRMERMEELQSHLMLLSTGFSRSAAAIAEEQIRLTPKKGRELCQMYSMVDEAVEILTGHNNLIDFGKLLGEAWQLKRGLTSKITTSYIDDIYNTAINNGAVGGKLLGAGGGGFMLLFVEPEKQEVVRQALRNLLFVPFKFESEGSKIVVYQP